MSRMMKRIAVLLLVLPLLWVGPLAAEGYAAGPRLRCLYYERELVLGGISAPRLYDLPGRPTAGIVPHHLLASDMIAGFFSLATGYGDSYDTVVLVSPSHYPERCGSDVVTAWSGWDTPFGSVEVDGDIVDALLRNPAIGAEDNPAAIEYDHGVAGLVPFVRHYLPDAKIATCLLSNKLSRQRLAAVQQELADQCGERVLLVSSVDFSHYLMPEAAAMRDAETAAAVEAFDLQRILGFSDSNVDSPQALTSCLTVARARGLTLTRLDHSSSPEKLPHSLSNPIYSEGITTYFVYAG